MGGAILVTGGAGYVGSHACKALAAAGYRPIVLDNLSRGHRWAVRWGPLEVHDLSNKAALRQVLEKHAIAAVMHFAAYAYVGESVRDPRIYYRNNVANSLNLLEAMIDVGVDHLVFSSTCAIYGSPSTTPIDEGHAKVPINPYGESKLSVERMLRWHGEAYGLRWCALRYFNAAGADPDGEIGEEHEDETHLIPSAMQAALGSRPFIEVMGCDYPTPDGTAIRDYVHVSDLADAHVRALDYVMTDGNSAAFNLGTGRGHSVREILRAVARATGKRIPAREAARRVGDPPILVADASRARTTLGWTPRRSDLETIVDTAFRWHQRRHNQLGLSGGPNGSDGESAISRVVAAKR